MSLRDGDRIHVGDGVGDDGDIAQLREEFHRAERSYAGAAQDPVVAHDRHVCEGRQGLERSLDVGLHRTT